MLICFDLLIFHELSDLDLLTLRHRQRPGSFPGDWPMACSGNRWDTANSLVMKDDTIGTSTSFASLFGIKDQLGKIMKIDMSFTNL